MDRYKINLIIILISLVVTIEQLHANCQGCCSNHKGVVCSNSITQCRDGSSLSDRCQSKGCSKCSLAPAIKTSSTKTKKKQEKATITKYNRSLFKHWVDSDSDCQDTRAEVLIKYNLGELKFKTKRQCIVVSGKWIDPYSGNVFTKANDLDVDHIIPLKKAYILGANKWSPERRKQFANDPENLVPAWKKLNRQKGAKGPSAWMPPLKEYHCKYLMQWNRIKRKYHLQQIGREIASIDNMIKFCK